MEYAIESGNYNILKVLDRKTRKAIWIKEHLFNPAYHARIKGEFSKSKEHLHELYGKVEQEEQLENGIEEDIEEVELDENGEEVTDKDVTDKDVHKKASKKNQEKKPELTEESKGKYQEASTSGGLYDGLKKADLIVIAQQKGLKVDPTWSTKKILETLEA